MTMLQPDVFYRRYGVRIPQHLMAPIMPALEAFQFPRNAVYHFQTYDGVDYGPQGTDYLFRNIDRKMFVEFAQELKDQRGSPRRLNVNPTTYVRDFHVKRKMFRPTQDVATNPTDEQQLAIVSYGLLPKMYAYTRSAYSAYYAWINIQKTMWLRIRDVAAVSERQQYVFAKIPKILPSVGRLNQAMLRFDQNTVRQFNTHELMFVLELWRWLSVEHRNESVIGAMDQKQLDKINIVFEESGRWCMINLGLLNSWRYTKGTSPADQRVKIEPEQLHRRFLRMLMVIMENRTVLPTEVLDDEAGGPVENPSATASVSNAQDDEDVSKAERIQAMLKTMDEDLHQLEVIEKVAETNLRAEDRPPETAEAKTLKRPMAVQDGVVDPAQFDNPRPPEQHVKDICDGLAEDGLLSGSEYRRFQKAIETTQSITGPDGQTPLAQFAKVPPEALKLETATTIKDIPTVLDKSMLQSSLFDFDSKYIANVMQRDIASMSVAAQRAGFLVTKYEVEKNEDVLGATEMHSIRIMPVDGSPSTLHMKLPTVTANGEYQVGGVRYRMRKQRGDLPIRKIDPSSVSLTTYYGKTFVNRNEKKVNSYPTWLHDQVMAAGLDEANTHITDLHPANVFDPKFACPRGYSVLAQSFKTFKCQGYDMFFDHRMREPVFGADLIKKYERHGFVFVGSGALGSLMMDTNNTIYLLETDTLKPLGSLEAFLGLSDMDAPVEFAEARIFGKNIPVGVILAYKYGLTDLMSLLKVTPRRVNAGQRLNLQESEYALVFQDESLVFSRDDRHAALILAGFGDYHRAIKGFTVHTFDKKGVYLSVLEQYNISARYLREIDLMDAMFVDPISEQILKDMQEPTTFRGLLVRATELLINDQHPHALDMDYMRIKGYERFAGAVYAELVNSVREHKSKIARATNPIEMNPYAVWKRITTDPSISLVEDINPIRSIKDAEAVTYGGVGGRSSRSMVRSTREFYKTDQGLISEATSDSSDVAINTYLSSNPMFDSIRGTPQKNREGRIASSSLVSTACLLSVGSDRDSPQRVNLASIQHDHGIACDGYVASAVRTGEEQVIASRANTGFAKVATQDGKVTSITADGVIVEYKDGTTEGFEIGRRYGKAGGLTIAHQMVSDLKEGQRFQEGDAILYHKGFFERDRLNPKVLVWKSGALARVALVEARATHEDASAISQKLADKLMTQTTKIKVIHLQFTDVIKNLIAANTPVEHETVLCTIVDSISDNAGLFDQETLNTLGVLSNHTPTAKVSGMVERIQVFYNGDKDDMSESLRKITDESDRELARRNRAQGKKAFTGQVDESFRIKGEPLGIDELAIYVYITSNVSAGIGDKGVFANQMKTVFSEIDTQPIMTESGLEVDARFSSQSIFNRIVTNPFIIGTTNVLLSIAGRNAAKIYRGEKP